MRWSGTGFILPCMSRRPRSRSRPGRSVAPKQVNIQEAKAKLSSLIERAEAGEEIIIARDGHPCARLVPLATGARRDMAGMDKGKIWIADDFDATPQDLADSFYDSKFP